MSALWIRLRQGGRLVWGIAVLVLTAIVVGLVYGALRKKDTSLSGDGKWFAPVSKAAESIAASNFQAAVEIAVARAKDAAVKEELASVLSDQDAARRRRRLADLGTRAGL